MGERELTALYEGGHHHDEGPRRRGSDGHTPREAVLFTTSVEVGA